jgi:hypothetical protein
MALGIALLMLSLAFVVAVTVIAVAEQDNSFNQSQECSQRAYVTAISGLEYYKLQKETILTLGTATQTVPDATYTQQFTVTVRQNGDIESLGEIFDSTGRPLANCTVVAPGGEFTRVYNATQ